jgi:hypothetical protein
MPPVRTLGWVAELGLEPVDPDRHLLEATSAEPRRRVVYASSSSV